MKTIRFSLTCVFCLFFLLKGVLGQNYVRLEDASGYTPTSQQIAELELAADSLCAAFDSAGFSGQFKVYDFGFYLHQEVTEGGYPESFAQKIAEVAELSPYYLLFGKQSDRNGVYTKFWIELVLPDTGKFGCLDLLSPSLRSEIKQKIEYTVINTYINLGSDYLYFDIAEKAGIEVLQKLTVKYTECCDLQSRSVASCDAFVLPAQMKEVTYSGDAYIEMKQDGDVNFGQPFPIPHYLDTRPDNEQSPLALVGGFNVSALVKFNGNELYETIKVRGKGEKEVAGVTVIFNFDEQAASQDIMTKQITASLSSTIPYMAVFLDDLKIKWEIRVMKTGEPEGDWEPVGESINDWYLTLKQPIAEESGMGYLHFHTLFDISCRYGRGYSDIELTNGVWEHFSSRQVQKGDGQPLKYYGQWSEGTLASKTSDLLQNKDGMCMAWTRLLLDVLKVHGFQESDNFVIVTAAQSEGFFIKEWKKNVTQGTSGNPNYPYKNIANDPLYNANNSYNWASAEVILNKASASQNNENPQSDFRNHIFARINGTFYDPSYGLSYMKSEIIPDPIDPNMTIETIPILDNYASCFYNTDPNNPSQYNIQMNTNTTSDIFVISRTVGYISH